MTPIEFPEQNVVFAKDQPEYRPLPALRCESGEVISCFELSFRERPRILFKGKLWVSMLMFGQPLTPIFLTTEKKEVIVKQ